MKKENARKIIQYVVAETELRWREYDKSWHDINKIMILHGYEQSGFEFFKFAPLLEERNLLSIEKLGGILSPSDCNLVYKREYAGSLESPFYLSLTKRYRNSDGKYFIECVRKFLKEKLGKPGAFFWKLIWQMLVCCCYLNVNYGGSFSRYIKVKFANFRKANSISDAELLNASTEEWEIFKREIEPWSDLKGIGENVFDFIFGDIIEARFAVNSYKLDSSNQYFLSITGISDLLPNLNRENVISFLNELGISYTLREINKGIYTYSSETESDNFGFCREIKNCRKCGVQNICEKRFGKVRVKALKTPVNPQKSTRRLRRRKIPPVQGKPISPFGHIIVDQILEIAKGMGYFFATNDLNWDGNQAQICIGIPTKKPSKRKIWRGFFWVKPETNMLEFWLPKQTNLSDFSKKTNLRISETPPTHSVGVKKNSFLAFVPLNRLDLTKEKHRIFIKEVINLSPDVRKYK